MSINKLFLPAYSQIPTLTANDQKWRILVKPTNSNFVSFTGVFTFKDVTAQYNLTSASPFTYMTILHFGSGTGSNGIQVCLVRRTNNSADVEIGLRYSAGGSTWAEISNSFVSLTSIGSLANDAFMFLFSLNINTNKVWSPKLAVVQFNATTTKSAPDLNPTIANLEFNANITITSTFGIGGLPDSSIDSVAPNYIETSHGYNSVSSQNTSFVYCNYWNVILPVTSSTPGVYAMFNTVDTNFSLYDINKRNDVIPSTATSCLFQMIIPSTTLSTINNTPAGGASTLVTLTPTFNTVSILPAFGINNTTGYVEAAVSDIPCLMKGTKILMHDNSYKLIEDIFVGDQLLTHDNRITKVQKKTHYNVIGINENCPFVIKKGTFGAFENLYLSPGHSILVEDYFIASDNRLLKLEKDLNFNKIEYYNLQVTNFYNDTIIANGVIVETWDGFEKSEDVNIRKFNEKYINKNGHRCLKNSTK